MKKLKNLISLGIVFAISVNILCSASYAYSGNTTNNIIIEPTAPTDYVMSVISDEDMGEILYTHTLYDSEGNVVGYCTDTENGYVIYDTVGNIIEYSPSNESPYLNIIDDVYYGGPLEYYEEKDGEYVHINEHKTTESVLFDDDILPNTELATDHYDLNSTSAGNYEITESLTHSTRKLNYNIDDLNACGSLATTIMFLYYYDNVSVKFGNPLLSLNPYYMFEDLRLAIEPNHNGTNPISLYTGIMNNYSSVTNLNSLNLQITNSSMFGKCRVAVIDSDVPCILNILGHPIYGNHWVVTHGVKRKYYNNTLTYKWFIVNDGHGSDNILINYSYADCLIYVTSYN